jgi:hypothetical protein
MTITFCDVARMDCPGSMAHDEMIEGVLYGSSMLHRFGLPYDYAQLESSLGSATRGDAKGTAADSMHTRSSSWQ